MTQRFIAALILLWALGFVIFGVTLPKAVNGQKTDGVVVLTGGQGRIQRGADILEQHLADRMLISGANIDLNPKDLERVYHIPRATITCCIDLGQSATDTRSNAQETAAWIKQHHYTSVRIVTNNWHMTRARFEMSHALPANVAIVSDAVEVQPSIGILLLEYDKYLWRQGATLLGIGG